MPGDLRGLQLPIKLSDRTLWLRVTIFLAIPALDYLDDGIWSRQLAHSLPACGLWVLQVGNPSGGGREASRALVIDFCHHWLPHRRREKKKDTIENLDGLG